MIINSSSKNTTYNNYNATFYYMVFELLFSKIPCTVQKLLYSYNLHTVLSRTLCNPGRFKILAYVEPWHILEPWANSELCQASKTYSCIPYVTLADSEH